MKKTLFLFFISYIVMGFQTDQVESNTWTLKKNQNGVSVYSRDAENSRFKELKSVTIYKSSLSSLIALIDDFESYPQWVYKCAVSTTIKKNSEKDLIHYQSVIAPWPVDNRDFVVHVQLQQDPVTKVIIQNVSCIPDYIPRVKGHVRITEFKARWTLIPLKDGYVEANYELLVNPGGNVPAWIVNLAAVDGPYETAINMKKMLMKEKYQKAVVLFVKEPL
jgi:hypothetical protein